MIKKWFYLFGTHYRQYYGLPINAKIATIDTIYGGLSPEQVVVISQSLRLVDSNDKEYVMRAVKKSNDFTKRCV
jgi:hypothetical protein